MAFLVVANGVEMGCFEGATEAAAVEAYAKDAGYRSFAALADALGKSAEEARAELRVTPVEARRVSWRDVPVTGREGAVTGEARLAALRSYRDSGTMAEAWPCSQADFDGPWDNDGPKASGPTPEQIDWSGLDGEAALGLVRARWATSGWAEWSELADIAGLEGDTELSAGSAPSLSEALEVSARRDGPARRLLEELHKAGVRVDWRGSFGDGPRLYAPEAAPRGERVPRPWLGPAWA